MKRRVFAYQIVGFTGPEDVVWTEVAEPATDGGMVIDVVVAGVSSRTCCRPKTRTR